MPIHACVQLPIIKDQPVGRPHSRGCVLSLDAPVNTHKVLFESLFMGIPNTNLKPNKSPKSQLFSHDL